MTTVKNVIRKLANNEDGAALVEYGLLIGLIAVICIASVTTLGQSISIMFKKIASALPTS